VSRRSTSYSRPTSTCSRRSSSRRAGGHGARQDRLRRAPRRRGEPAVAASDPLRTLQGKQKQLTSKFPTETSKVPLNFYSSEDSILVPCKESYNKLLKKHPRESKKIILPDFSPNSPIRVSNQEVISPSILSPKDPRVVWMAFVRRY